MQARSTLAGRYELEREIGRGATGSVWVALDKQLGRLVAVKVLDAARSIAGSDGLVAEAKTIALLRSPHVVQVFDVAFHEERPLIVMELLQGESLEARLLRHRRLPLRLVATLMSDIAKGLAAIHDAGIIHRDLKPANVFLAHEAGREVPKLLDFGIAIPRRQSELTGRGVEHSAAGTPLYMSPEHFGGELDERSDVWSLGVIAYEMLTGSRPFEARTRLELEAQICSGAYARASSVLSERGAEFDALFERALATEPSRRFQSATALCEELHRIAQSESRRVIRVLFLDDEIDMKLLLERRFRRQLREGSYEIHFATDGEAGLEVLRQRPDMDVVLTDLNMPRMDGLTLLAHLPSINPLIKAVVVTAYDDMTNIRTAMNRGAFDFLCKPIDFSDLERTIEKCADSVAQLRAAVDSREQNGIFRVLLGQSLADRLVAAMRTSERLRSRTFDATVVAVHVSALDEVLREMGPEQAFVLLSAHFDAVIPELLSRQGDVSRFTQDSLVAIFEGEGHLFRAVEACLTIRDRLQRLDVRNPSGPGQHGVAIGLDAGSLTAGLMGSLAFGRLEAASVGIPVQMALELQRAASRHDILVSPAVESALRLSHRIDAVQRSSLLNTGAPRAFQLRGPCAVDDDLPVSTRGSDESAVTRPLDSAAPPCGD
jgi:CheY-like chemotaxis protein